VAIVLGMAVTFVLIARGADNPPSTSDTAVIESFTILASRGNLMLGPYSRFQWHHPGPLCFFWMAPFHVLSGARTTGLNAGALLLNLLAGTMAGWVLVRRANGAFALGAVVALGLFVWRTPELLVSPWNPHLPVLATIALLVTAADAISGTDAAFLPTLLFASFVGQTHLALLPLAITVGGIVLLARVVRIIRGSDERPRVARGALATMGLLVVWLPTLLEQHSSEPGNLAAIWTFFTSQERHGQPFNHALSAWADMMAGSVRPDFYVARGWRFVESPVRWAEILACVQMLALVAVFTRGWRRRMPFDASLAALLLVASLVALWSATNIEEEIFDHAVFWMSGIGALNLGALASLAFEGIAVWTGGRRLRPLASIGGFALAGMVFLGGIRELRGSVQRSFSPGPESVAAREVASDLQRFLEGAGVERPLILFDQDAWGMDAGVVLQLQKAGVPVAVEDDWMAMYTPAFAATGRERVAIAIVGEAEHVRRSSQPGTRLLSSRSPLFAYLVNR
jgi:hypothetical protein